MDAAAVPSMTDPPFAVAADIVVDLPVPPSVNRTRRIDWTAKRSVEAWKNVCDSYVMAAKARKISPLKLVTIEKFELIVTLSEQHTKIDLDNGIKALIDYLRRINLIKDDSKACMRRLVVEWGNAPFGCRVTVRSLP